jgi:MFS family permease
LASIAVLAAPIVWFGFRSVPEGKVATHAAAPLEGLEVAEARATSAYWLLTAMSFAMASGIAGVVVHLVPLFRDLGTDPLEAARVASLVGLSSVVGRLGVGLLLDRFPAPLVALSVLGLAALGIILLLGWGAGYGATAALLLGLAAGAEIDLLAYLTAAQFGKKRYGAIYGWQYSVFALGYGLSPFLVGRMRDASGDYAGALMTSAALLALSAVLALGLGKPPNFFRSGSGS